MANWSPAQLANARLIIAVGLEMRMSSRDILVGIMTAMQESSLRNVSGGDRDSLGLFQQRPSQGWGSTSQIMDPIYATRKFFTTLKGVGNRNNMQLWQAAQAVQRSGFPMAYANWENDARRLMNGMGQAGGVTGGLPYPLKVPRMDLSLYGGLASPEKQAIATTETMGGIADVSKDNASPAAPGAGAVLGDIQAPQQPAAEVDLNLEGIPGLKSEFAALKGFSGGGARGSIIKAAMGVIGTPYSWGGGGAGGKSYGIAQGSGINGFDCSGLVQYALARAGIKAPRVSYDQATIGLRQTNIKSLQPGDLVVKDDGSHIAIYAGNGKMIEAPYTGGRVRVVPVRSGMYGVHLNIGGDAKLHDPRTAEGFIQGPSQSTTSNDKIELPPGVEAPQPTPLTNFPGIQSDMQGGMSA